MVILEHRGDSADPSKHQAGEKYAHDANVERHMIYFRVTPYGIAIIRILHDRMDASRQL